MTPKQKRKRERERDDLDDVFAAQVIDPGFDETDDDLPVTITKDEDEKF